MGMLFSLFSPLTFIATHNASKSGFEGMVPVSMKLGFGGIFVADCHNLVLGVLRRLYYLC